MDTHRLLVSARDLQESRNKVAIQEVSRSRGRLLSGDRLETPPVCEAEAADPLDDGCEAGLELLTR
jgi:hypothetical protein